MHGRKLLRIVAPWLFTLLASFALLEVSLRLFPRLIPPFLLADFHPAARQRVAEGLGYPTDRTVRLLPRTDGGPPWLMRVFRPRASVTLTVSDAGFVQTVTMDEEGFCNAAPQRPRHEASSIFPDQPRDVGGSEPAEGHGGARPPLVALGDSFTWCTGVHPQATWPARLEAILGEPAVNLGSPGIGLYEYLQIYEQFGAARHPRVVVLNLYEGNDLRDAQRFHAYRSGVGAGPSAPARRLLKDRPLARNSYAYNLVVVGARALHRAVRMALGRWLGIPTGEEPEPEFRYLLRFGDAEVSFNPANLDQDEVRTAREMKTGELELSLFREGLEKFVETARREAFIPVVAYTPSAHTAYATRVAFRDRELETLMPWFSSRQREYLATLGRELGYRFVDLTPAFQRAAAGLGADQLLYFPTVLHLTERGHAVAASALAEFLRSDPGGDRMSAGPLDSGRPPTARMDPP